MNIINLTDFDYPDNVQKLFQSFRKAGFEIRLVGGCVRDALLKRTPKDYDMATTATPDEMIQIAEDNDLSIVKANKAHGTIIFVFDDTDNIEVTTLRTEEKHDGRHAEVKFIKDWEVDAFRRDFTINAMSMDESRQVYNYSTGIDDLKASVIRFMGVAEDRIIEDHLRMLRMFRMTTKFGQNTSAQISFSSFEACKKLAPRIQDISKERIWQELKPILRHPQAQHVLSGMFNAFLLQEIIPFRVMKSDIARAGYFRQFTDNPVSVLSAFVHGHGNVRQLYHALRLSNREEGLLNFLWDHAHIKFGEITKSYINAELSTGVRRECIIELAKLKTNDQDIIDHAATFQTPDCPVDGNDLLNMGIPRGPQFGEILSSLKSLWLESDFSRSKDDLLKIARSMI